MRQQRKRMIPTKQYDALTTQVNEAKTNLVTAKTNYDATKKQWMILKTMLIHQNLQN